MSPDKDLGQCISGDRVVQIDRRQRKLTNEEAFRALRGFGPKSMPDYLALTGDTADGIPGLPGFGEKAASMLIGAYEHIENIPADPASWDVSVRGAARVAGTLASMQSDALLYRRLATLIYDVPLRERTIDLAFHGVPRPAFEAWCDRLGVTDLKERPKRWA